MIELGESMGKNDYPKKVSWRETTQRCSWCGKPEVRFLYSGKKDQYCSFRCNAGGMYPRSVLISIASSMLISILIFVFVAMQVSHPYTPIPSFFGLVLAIPIILNFMFIYTAYVGRVVVREKQSGIDHNIYYSSENGGSRDSFSQPEP